MKKGYRHIIPIVVSMAMVVLMAACSSESTDTAQRPTERELRFVLCQRSYIDVTPMSLRRALPTGYVVYDQLDPQTDIANARIHTYVTHASTVDFQGDFIYNGESSWTSKVPLNDGDYYIYGFMPTIESAKIAISQPTGEGKSYADGAVLTTTTGLNALTNSDICAIVGVKGWKNHTTPIEDVGIQLGQFKLNADEDGDNVYVLLDHLYAALEVDLKIDYSYRQLRSVKLTKLEMQSPKAASLTVTLTPNETNTSPLTVEQSMTAGSSQWVTIYDGAEKELKTDGETDVWQHFLSFVAPGDNKTFKMRTTYNVYDRKGNLIRRGCTAENTLTLPSETTLQRGEKFVFYLTVEPTYLYVLSDPDLDNPTINS